MSTAMNNYKFSKCSKLAITMKVLNAELHEKPVLEPVV